MFVSLSLVTLFLASISHAAPTVPSSTSVPTKTSSHTKTSVPTNTSIHTSTSVPTSIPVYTNTSVNANTSVPLIHSTTLSKNVTLINAGQVFNDVAAVVDANKTVITEESLFIPIKFFTCESAIEAKATQLKANVGTPTSDYITDASLGTIHKNYIWGAVYCHDPFSGAHAVYGEIWLKFKSTSNYGYPITDETGTTDNAGTVIRFNTFSQGNAIYWTGNTGAHLIYGDIYKRWISIGDTKSVVGFPITDESGSGTHGGRYNDFSNGMIYWHAGSSYVHTGALPSSLTFTWSPINLGDVSGWTTITFTNNGNARWQSHLHASVPWEYDWSIAFVFMDADGTSLSLSKHGSVGPNWGIFGSSNDADVDQTVNNAEISANWRAWVAMTQWRSQADTSFAWLEMLTGLYNEIKAIYPYAAAVISILA